MIVGHGDIVQRVIAEQPRVAVFLGPPSVGKWAAAEDLRFKLGIFGTDVLRVNKLTASAARDIVAFAATAPANGDKLVIAALDGTAAAQHALLKTLEDAPAYLRFFLIAEREPLATISSRASTYAFRKLTVPEVAEVLRTRLRMPPNEAQKAAALSGGQVAVAVQSVETMELKPLILTVLKAFRERDPAILEGAARFWTDEHTKLLTQWCYEAGTQRWKWFTEAESEVPQRNLPLRMLIGLSAWLRPRLTVRVTLMTLLKEG